MLGYFIETTDTHAERMLSPPLSETFIHRQTTANQVRFTTVPLSEMETRILNAGNHALEIEKRLYDGLKAAVLAEAGPIGAAARALAEIDLAAALGRSGGGRELGASRWSTTAAPSTWRAGGIRWWSAPCGGRGRGLSSPTTAR